jgi:hypothetical protein
MERKFSSFEEIDNQLEILSVQRQLSLERLKSQIREAPGKLIQEGWVHSVRPALINMALGWMIHQLREVRRKIRPELPQLQ